MLAKHKISALISDFCIKILNCNISFCFFVINEMFFRNIMVKLYYFINYAKYLPIVTS